MPAKLAAATKAGLHPRNVHGAGYDFAALSAVHPPLAAFVGVNAYQRETIPFDNPLAVKALNCALLKLHYGIGEWDIPPHYLCPPIPGRADYIHHLADALALSNGGSIPQGRGIRVLDIGVGANCIYPLLGHAIYGWSFVGSDIDADALASAQALLKANPASQAAISLRLQTKKSAIFAGVLKSDELFDMVLCNPPFHASLAEATAGTQRKWKNLGKAGALNFGGKDNELCCEGGEAGFIGRMIEESRQFQSNCLWFSVLVSKEKTLPGVTKALKEAGVAQRSVINMAQGQKTSRLLLWSFFDERQQQAWRNQRRA